MPGAAAEIYRGSRGDEAQRRIVFAEGARCGHEFLLAGSLSKVYNKTNDARIGKPPAVAARPQDTVEVFHFFAFGIMSVIIP